MWMALRRLAALGFMSLLLTATAFAGDGVAALGPVYDITHFDVLPIASPDSEQIAYAALFKYRDASKSDRGSESFRIINWLEATNHSFIVDVWKSREAFEHHLAQPHSVDFRFAVQNVPPPDGICCIGSPIDDRQYSLVESFGTPWISNKLPTTVGIAGALFVVIYVDLLQDARPGKGKNQLVRYGAMSISSSANRGHLLNFSLLRQLDRPNRYAILEAWDTEASYNAWQGSAVTASFVDKITPLLGSPLDHRLNSLCGETYIDGAGCTPP
ncbi:MAG: antibiotic biosynthesis monooxygenase [Stellaceae bacterium]